MPPDDRHDSLAVPVVVPRGAPAPGGERQRTVLLRAAGPEEEALVLDAAADAPPAAVANAVLARCLAEGEPFAQRLTVGDREALLLHLRRLTVGSEMECVIRCPEPGCGEDMELVLSVDELLVPPYPQLPDTPEVAVAVAGSEHRVRFRLPTAGDLERAAALARADPDAGAADLLRACILEAARDGTPVAAADVPDDVGLAVAAAMAEHDPQAELELDLRCPACGAPFSSVLDVGAYLLDELRARGADALRDVHALAQHYGWSEEEILRTSPRRREHYLALIAEASARTRAR